MLICKVIYLILCAAGLLLTFAAGRKAMLIRSRLLKFIIISAIFLCMARYISLIAFATLVNDIVGKFGSHFVFGSLLGIDIAVFASIYALAGTKGRVSKSFIAVLLVTALLYGTMIVEGPARLTQSNISGRGIEMYGFWRSIIIPVQTLFGLGFLYYGIKYILNSKDWEGRRRMIFLLLSIVFYYSASSLIIYQPQAFLNFIIPEIISFIGLIYILDYISVKL